MRRFVTLITFIVLTCAGYAVGATLRGSYTDPAGYYVEPSEYYSEVNGARTDPANIGFENTSTATGPNEPGKVDVVLANVTTAGYYLFKAKNSLGNWRGYDWSYTASGGGVATSQDIWEYSARTLTSPVALAMSSYSGIDNRLTSTHGPGSWSAMGSVTILPFQGSVSYESASFGSDVHVVRGDSVSIPYSAGMDLTGWEVWFAAKANPADSAYAIGPVDVTSHVTAPVSGTGYIELSSPDTDAVPRRYFAELEVRGQGQVKTPLRFYLWIDPDVIR